MTIKKFEIELFKISRTEALATVRQVLVQFAEYRGLEQPDENRYRVLVKPRLLIGALPMTIDLYEHPDGTVLRVEMRRKFGSKWDSFGYLDRNLREFLSRFREKVLLDTGT